MLPCREPTDKAVDDAELEEDIKDEMDDLKHEQTSTYMNQMDEYRKQLDKWKKQKVAKVSLGAIP